MKDVQYYLKLNYPKTVSKHEDGIYVVEIPDLPGCVADGDTIQEAFQNIEEAMEVWIASSLESGAAIPEPRTVDEFSGRFLLRTPKWLHHTLAQQAAADGTSLNQYVVALLSESVGKVSEIKASAAVFEKSTRALTDALQRIERVTEYSYKLPESRLETRVFNLNLPQEGSQIGAASPFQNRPWVIETQQGKQGFITHEA